MKIAHIVGARPNFMKAAPVFRALSKNPSVEQVLIHTGQHYNANMSDVFFKQLGLVEPDHNLQVGSGSHAQQTAEIMRRIEPLLNDYRPDWLMVYGDVNSTAAAALVCSKIGIRVAHVEAGLRSFDRRMPEEINRLVTDQISDLLFTPSEDADRNLAREGIAPEKIHFVGNVMIDTLVHLLPAAMNQDLATFSEDYILVTLHRPSNVDDDAWLRAMIARLTNFSEKIPVIFPIHPRTRGRMQSAAIKARNGTFHMTDPLPYLSFLALQQKARLVITDSGGIQEETTYLGVPCITVRENTERPITVELGTNILVGRNIEQLTNAVEAVFSGRFKKGTVPPLWDGRAGERIASVILRT